MKPDSIFLGEGVLLGCEVCGAHVNELRRGRCWGCYSRWADSRPVGVGAQCLVCPERRRDNLRQVELLGNWHPMCHNCAHRAMALRPMPQTLEEVRRRATRDRRRADRRCGRVDGRIFPRERRGLERRGVGRGEEYSLDEADIEIIDAALDEVLRMDVEGDITGIRGLWR